jgi:hypothetical protein
MLDIEKSYTDELNLLLNLIGDDDLEKSFSIISEAFLLNKIDLDTFEKAQRVYMNNTENKRLKRVGKPYGNSGQDEPNKDTKEGKTEPSKDNKEPEKSIEDHAKEASEADLQRTVKEGKDAELRQAAHEELDRRTKEEHVQEESSTDEKPKTNTKEPESKESDSSVSKEDKSNFSINREQYNIVKQIIDKSNIKIENLQKAFGGLNDIETIENIYEFLGGANNIGKIDNLEFDYSKDCIEISLENEVLSIERIYNYNTKDITNFSFSVKNKGKGLGTTIFKNQIEAYQKQGYKKLLTKAIKTDSSNGYYTWARLGYDIEEGSRDSFIFKELVSNGDEKIKSCKTLSELMSSKEGREFWKNYGFAFMGTFDLSEKSENLKTLNKYINEKSKDNK